MASSRVALVTGGTRGIGRAISEALKTAGYNVAANYGSNDEAAEKFHEETGVAVHKFDVSDFNDVRNAVDRITEELGPVEILVNNAGITRDAPLHKMSPDQWQAVIETNLTSCFNTSRCVIESMRQNGFGRIINIGSMNGQAGQFGQINYSSAKAGLIGFTKALALEGAGKGITVNCVAPGYTETDMVRAVPSNVLEKIVQRIPVGRLGQAEEMARAVVFLADDAAGYITGTTISINGGQYLC